MKIGIDPGLKGAIAFVSNNNIELFDMPTESIPWAKTSKYKTRIDSLELYVLMDSFVENNYLESITIEIVGPMPKQGITSTWHFSGAFHTAIAVSKLFLQPRMVLPSQWKKRWGLINMPKDMSRLTVIKMYPHLLPLLKRKKDVDRAEALLIATS